MTPGDELSYRPEGSAKLRYNRTMNAEVVLPLDKMTISEKLEVMEVLWDDISRYPAGFQSPEWHESYLRELEESVAAGKEKFFDLDEAEKIIREQTP